eukprot:TRINITY_DN6932_c0_g1_i1.p1 TRINITY_DN6932_c0_g1~~TRINITY_DN6932_c0_g1_i1.p1  ORF type:complete len:245 (-),score=57.00 TRINITY_DN6932_c0_g1_i1:50-784(-)
MEEGAEKKGRVIVAEETPTEKKEEKKRRKKIKVAPYPLLEKQGFPLLMEEMEKIFKAVEGDVIEGNEIYNLRIIVDQYQNWSSRLYPTIPFDEFIHQTERLCSTKKFRNSLHAMAAGEPVWGVTPKETSPFKPEAAESRSVEDGDEFEEMELPLNIENDDHPQPAPLTAQPISVTAEQIARAEENRRKALEKRQQASQVSFSQQPTVSQMTTVDFDAEFGDIEVNELDEGSQETDVRESQDSQD